MWNEIPILTYLLSSNSGLQLFNRSTRTWNSTYTDVVPLVASRQASGMIGQRFPGSRSPGVPASERAFGPSVIEYDRDMC
jgi:hypothetical protein